MKYHFDKLAGDKNRSTFGVKSSRLFPFPPSLMQIAGKLTGKSEAVDRLVGSLTVDSSKIHRELGWKPPYTMEQGLKQTAEWFKEKF